MDAVAEKDWRVGLRVRAKYIGNPLYRITGMIRSVEPSGYLGIKDKDGVLVIEMSEQLVIGKSDDWETA